MNIKKYFETSETEPRLIDIISIFYLIRVIGYTIGERRGNHPIILIVAGLLFHVIAILAWLDENKEQTYFGRFKEHVYKVLPFGLLITYTTSIVLFTRDGVLTNTFYFNIITFFITAMPMIMFYISMAFNVRAFDFLKQNRKGTNNLVIAFEAITLIMLPVLNN